MTSVATKMSISTNAIVPKAIPLIFCSASKSLKGHGEGDHKQDFDVEEQENDRDRVKLDREPVARRSYRVLAAFVRHQLGRRPLARADKLRHQQLAGSETEGDDKHDPDRGIIHKAEFRHFDLLKTPFEL